MRIGFFTGSLGGDNGWARLSLETVRHVAALGIECRVVMSPNETDEAPHRPVTELEPLALLPGWPQGLLRWPIAIARSLPATVRALSDCDLLHCLMEPYLPVASLVSLLNRRPLVATAVGTYSVRTLAYGPPLTPFTFWSRRAERVVCISRYTEKRLQERAPSAPTVVVNPGVDADRFRPGKPQGRAGSVDGRVILSAGAVKPRKGYHIAIEALARLDSSLADTALYIVGSEETHSDFADSLRQLASRLGVDERVHFLGTISENELVDWYRRADVFILNASNKGEHFEGFGLVLLEANACGTPVIACHESGAEDIVIPGENGLLIPQDDPAATVSALSMLLGESELRQRMARRGLDRAAVMTWRHSARELITVYEEVLSMRRAKVPAGAVKEGR